MDNRARAFRATLIKLGAFVISMVLVFVLLVVVFSRYRSGSSDEYSAVFTSASAMKSGSKVKIAGVEVGSVNDISLQQDHNVAVGFNVDSKFPLPKTVRALIRYENLTGDRFLELQQGTGDQNGMLSPGDRIPVSQTEPALDLDKLLGGFKPLFRTLNPAEINELSSSLIEVFQGYDQRTALTQLLANTSKFTNSLADRDQLIGAVIDNLNKTMATIEGDRTGFDTSVDRLQQLVSGLAEQRGTIGNALTQTSRLTNSLADLLVTTRPDIKSTAANLGKTSGEVLKAEPYIRGVIQRLPQDYKILSNVGSYGAWLQLWLCRIRLVFNGPGDQLIWWNSVDVSSQSTRPGGRCYPR